jgi:hypothetical protein
MANNVTLPASGTGDVNPKASTDQVTADQSQVQNVQLAAVAGGVLTRNPTIPVSAASLPLPAGASLDATLTANGVLAGAVNETAPATDTASSGLNGRLQRVAQRLTSLIALLPASLGQKTMANGLAVTIASDQTVVPVSDNAGSLTIDAPVGTPAFVRFSDGATAQTPVRVDNAAFTDNASNITPVGYYFDEVAGTALTENDAACPRIDSKRAVINVLEDATTRGQRQTVNAAKEALVRQPAATTGAAPTAFTSTTSAQIFASNALRKLFTIFNNSDKDCYVMLAAAAASATSFHTIVKANGGFFSTTDYSGEIRGIMAAAIGTGQVNCGEFT